MYCTCEWGGFVTGWLSCRPKVGLTVHNTVTSLYNKLLESLSVWLCVSAAFKLENGYIYWTLLFVVYLKQKQEYVDLTTLTMDNNNRDL